MRGLFVTGTDTGAGKSVVAAAIAATLRADGLRVAAAKPALTGLDDEPGAWPPDDALLAAVTGQAREEIAPVRFGPAVSPHLAAQLAGVELSIAEMVAHVRGLAGDVVVVEGVGGLLVPLSPHASVRDLARALALPVVVAARPGLGTINHTLLTLEAARAGGLDVRAVVLTPWPDAPSEMERSNAETISAVGGVPVATLGPVTAGSIGEARIPGAASWLDSPGPRPLLDHVVIAVSDWERSNAFYAGVAGAEVVRAPGDPPRWRYRFGAQQLNVHGPGMDPQPVARIPAEPGMADVCLVWPGTIDEAAQHVRDAGAEVELGPVPRNGARGPAQSVYFRDPDGSLLEFMAYG